MLRSRLAAALAVLFAAAALATLIWPTWIEGLTGLEPDAGSGESEWWLVALLGLAALTAALYSHRVAVRVRVSADKALTSGG
ncbi:MAG: hypothetical protein ABIW49_03230 [Knoellia sp.]